MILLWAIQLIHILALSVLEFFAYPEFFLYPYLTSAGWLPYSQIIGQHFPGLFFLPINFYTLGFITPRSFKILLILIVIFQSTLIYRIAKDICRKKLSGLFAVAAYAIWQPFFSGSHLWLESLISPLALTAFFLWLRQNWFWAGMALGSALMFTQSIAFPISVLAVFALFRQGLKPAAKFIIGSLLPLSLVVVYLGSRGVLSDFFFWTVKFNFFYAVRAATVPSFSDFVRLLLPVALFILAFFIAKPKRVAITFVAWGLILIPGGLSRFDFTRLQAVVPFLSLTTGLLITGLWFAKKYFWGSVLIIAVFFWLLVFYFRQANWGQYRFFDSLTLALVSKIESLTSPGDKVFLLGVQPHLYMLTKTYPPGNHFSYLLPWYLPLTQNRILYSLASDPPKYILYDPKTLIDGQSISDHAAPLVQYVQRYYVPISAIGSVKVYENRD